ncbi:MAG: hypothetical protein ABI758_04050 [Candidatus Woesebacteria bacterium]
MKNRRTSRSGFIALTSVLLILAVASAAAVVVTYSSIGEGQAGLALYKGEENLAFAEGCMEDNLLKIRMNSGYLGGNITRPEGTCTGSADGPFGWIVSAFSLTSTYQRRVGTGFYRYSKDFSGSTPGIHLTTWVEY